MMRRSAFFLLVVLFVAASGRSGLAQTPFGANAGAVSLGSARLPAKLRTEMVAAVARSFSGQPPEFPSGQRIALTSWVSFVRVSRTGPEAVLITSGPDDPANGATGNGEFWLFRQVGGHAVLVLEGGGYSAVPRRSSYHGGMLDFQTAWNMGPVDGGIEVYRFNGTRYQSAFCYSYAVDEEGKQTSGPHKRCEE